jgi:NAD(P)-dependent dehydrogenase (short-subunit alcohol dehydrogenase family)
VVSPQTLVLPVLILSWLLTVDRRRRSSLAKFYRQMPRLVFGKQISRWPFATLSEDLFDKVFSLNVKVPYFLVAELAPLMAKRGKGAIVNLSTMTADYGAFGMSLYGSSKAAINLLTKAWTAEYGRSGVRVNAVSPGPTRTEGTDSMGEGLDRLAAEAPAGRPATADEIAEAIVFLATDRGRETRRGWRKNRHLIVTSLAQDREGVRRYVRIGRSLQILLRCMSPEPQDNVRD